MRRISAALAVLLCCSFMMGSVSGFAQVYPSKNFYVTDHAGVISRGHRNDLSELAASFEEQTGVQAIMLTVKDLGEYGSDYAGYSRSILRDWGVGGEEQNGLLLLFCEQVGSKVHLEIGSGFDSGLAARFPQIFKEHIEPFWSGGNYSTGILNGYKALMRAVYIERGIPITDKMETQLRETKSAVSILGWGLIVVALFVMIRSMRVSRKYKQKYLYRHKMRQRSFVRTHNKNDDVTPKYTAVGERYPEERTRVRREGFIIYREPIDDDEPANE